ncbi:MAG TPA: hypothetical protein VFT45_26150 [Longimicrobium sp.]|nr:hypothetical protein [Longimicrobium sp.]
MKIRGWIALAAMLLLPAALRAQTPADSLAADAAPADPVRNFMYDLADPLALANALALGLYDHARTDPYEWGGGMDALTQRIASRAGGHVIGTSVRHGLAAALGRSTDIEPCTGCTSTEDRVTHAIVDTFTDRDDSGRRVISEPYLAGTFAGAIAPTLWHPDGNLGDGVKAGVWSVLFTTAGRVLFAVLEPLVPTQEAGAAP